MVECNDYDEYVKLKHDNEKLKKEFEEFKINNTIVLETLGDRHHLDGLVVIGSLVFIRRGCG